MPRLLPKRINFTIIKGKMTNFKGTIDKVSKLAAIKLTDEEKAAYSKELEPILKLLDNFEQINTEGIEPLRTVNHDTLIMRDDTSYDPLSKETVLASANNIKYDFFTTPKVIED